MNFYIKPAAILALSLAFASCSMVKSITGSDKTSSPATATEVNAGKTSAADQREKATPGQLGTKPTREQLTGGQWTVASVGDVTINADEDTPYLNFDSNGRFYASDGCNIINGDYVIKSTGEIDFSNTLSTMKYCPDVEYSALIGSIYSGATKLNVDCKRIGQETYLYLKNEKGNVMMTLRRHNMEFLNGNWRITSCNGKKIDDEEANLFIDIAELKIHGNTGCNFFNGQIYIDPAKSNAIDFSNIGSTRMMCPKIEQEQAILVSLEETASAVAGKNSDTVLLFNSKGKELLTLKKAPLPADDSENN